MAGERRKVRQLTAKLLRHAVDQSNLAGDPGPTPALQNVQVLPSFNPDVLLDQDGKFQLKHPVILLSTPSQRAMDEARTVRRGQMLVIPLIIYGVVAGGTYDDVDERADGLHHDIEATLFGDQYRVAWNKQGENNPELTWLGHFGELNVPADALGFEALETNGRNDFCYGGFVMTLEVRVPWCPPEHCPSEEILQIETTLQVHDQGVKANVHSDGGSPFAPGIILTTE